ncbi:MAG: hypothetical protein LBL35_01245 [Clostridiales bacterium]|jgi:hypothetical protein|nr:hypothetical protein [Clostridiales bacterium]
MKKLVFMVVALALSLISFSFVFAETTKQGLVDAARDTSGIPGRVDPVPDQYLKSLADFLNTDDYTQEELEFMSQALGEVKSIWAASGVADYSKMDKETQLLLQSKAISAAARVGATLTFDGSRIVILSKTGRSYAVSTTAGGGWSSIVDGQLINGDNPIKATGIGMNLTPVYILTGSVTAALTLIGAFILKDRKTAFAKS